MNNFINVRVQSYNHTKQLNILKHNLRKIKSLSEGAFNDVVGTSKHTSNFIIQKDGSLFELENKDFINLSYDFIVDEYKKDRKLHNEKMYKRKKRNLLNEQATWLEGVFTFSEAIHKDLGNKYTKEELSKIANDCAKHLAKEIGSELRYLVLHLDETTPHFHLAFKNFDNSGYSIFHKIKNKETLSRFQDIAFEYFGKLGMDRGISKEIIGKNYQNIQNYYKQQQMELKAIIQSLQVEVKQIQSNKKDILNNLDLTKSEKKQELDKLDLNLKSLRNTINEYKDIKNENDEKLKLKAEELKTLNNDINVANDTLNDLNKKINIKTQEVNSFEQVLVKNEDIINNLINKNITKNIVKQDVVINLDELKKEFNNFVNKTLKIDIKTKEIDVLKQENQEKDEIIKDLESKLKDKDSLLEKIITEKYEAIKENKILKQNDISKTNEIAKLKENHKLEIKRLQNHFKQQIALRVKRLNLINRLKRSNIANKIRLRLSKRKENFDLSR